MDQDQNQNQPEAVFSGASNSPAKKNGALLGVIALVVIVLVAGAWYLMKTPGDEAREVPTATQTTSEAVPADETTTALLQQGTGDDVTSIEADLNATDLGSLDEVNSI